MGNRYVFAAALIAHQRYVYEGDQYASHDTPGNILSRPLYAHHFQIGQEYDNPHTENGGKEKYHAEKDEDAAGVIFHRFKLERKRILNKEQGILNIEY